MAFSTQMITDLTTAQTNGPAAATITNSIAPAGPIMDYKGMTANAILKCQELQVVLGNLILNTDSGTDATNLALLQKVFNNLV